MDRPRAPGDDMECDVQLFEILNSQRAASKAVSNRGRCSRGGFLAMPRFGDVIRSIRGVKLDHFLNDGDSPDIPIPVYVGMLNQIREMALAQRPSAAGREAVVR